MAAQGGVAPADQEQLLITDPLSGKGLFQRVDNFTIARCRGLRQQSAGVRQHEQQRGRMPQAATQCLHVPAQQQRAAVHRLRSSGIVVDHDNLRDTLNLLR